LTIAGTTAYEAALLNVPAVVLAPVFFSRLNCCAYKTLADLSRCKNLGEWVKEIKAKSDNRSEFCQYLAINSFEGIMTDPVSNPAVLDPENIALLANAFKKVLSKLNSYAGNGYCLQD
jgi:hypothetical protein